MGNAKRCPSPVVNPKGFPSGRHIHQPGSGGVSVRVSYPQVGARVLWCSIGVLWCSRSKKRRIAFYFSVMREMKGEKLGAKGEKLGAKGEKLGEKF